MKWCMIFLYYILFIMNICGLSDSPPHGSTKLWIRNQAGATIQLFYVRRKNSNEEYVPMNEVYNLGEANLNSFLGHEFAIKFSKGSTNLEARFVKGAKEETLTVTYNKKKGFVLKVMSKFDEAKSNLLSSCAEFEGDITDCVAEILTMNTNRFAAEKAELTKTRDQIANRLRNYTCDDDYLNTTKALKTSLIKLSETMFTVNALYESSHANIWTVADFITAEECAQLESYARPRLRRATVAAPDGSAVESPSRRAQQAEYKGLADNPADPLWNLYLRTIGMTNKLSGWDLRSEGQEDLAITQYGVGDQYTPHCDGACDGSEYFRSARIATSVLYCKVADLGGGTTFSKADVFVKPEVGMATFFTYRGNDGHMDSGYTEHSGCPVKKGEKWISTLWMREHVSKSNPWSHSDPMGRPTNYFHGSEEL